MRDPNQEKRHTETLNRFADDIEKELLCDILNTGDDDIKLHYIAEMATAPGQAQAVGSIYTALRLLRKAAKGEEIKVDHEACKLAAEKSKKEEIMRLFMHGSGGFPTV